MRRYVILDVFTEKPLTGNPLAVVLDAGGLDSAAMQAIAREFNLSETVFVLPPEDPVNLAKLRIFMPHRELPFAGHPTVGTAVLLALENRAARGEDVNFVLEETIGRVPCTVRLGENGRGRAFFAIPRLPFAIGEAPDDAALAAALGLDAADIGFPGHRPSRFSAGNGFTFVPVRSLDAVRRVNPDSTRWQATFGGEGDLSAFVYTRETEDPASAFHARMLEPKIIEDPATGSAAAAFAGVIEAFEPGNERRRALIIEQGYEMGRPSRITLEVEIAAGKLVAASIGGSAVVVARGELAL